MIPIYLALYLIIQEQLQCFYTEKPVPYQDFEIDHIIPESRESDIEDIKKRLGLGDDFHINSVENLVPSRPGINLRKNGQVFSDNTLLLYFEQTADLTGDGIENIFCYVWRNADGGSMGWGETMILGCHSKDGVVEVEKM